MTKVFLIDGSSVFFRAYHAIADLRRSDGVATNAIYGYLLTIRNLLQEYKPEAVLVAFDRPEDTFRSELYKDYKANRAAPPDDLVIQIEPIKTVTKLLGLHCYESPGFEADDIIGTASLRLKEAGYQPVIVSGDKDMLQLVDDSVSMLRLQQNNKNKLYQIAEVEERYGVSPTKFIDVLALMGDAVDNVPGVPGIGEKTAIQLIQEYGSLDNLYGNLDSVSGKKRKENLVNFKDQAYLSRELVVICRDMPMDDDGFPYTLNQPKTNELFQFYTENEFRTFANEIQSGTQHKPVPVQYETIHDINRLKEVIQTIKEKSLCAFDTETTSLGIYNNQIVGMSLSVEPHQGWYIPFGHLYNDNLSKKDAYPLLQELFASDQIVKVAHNLKFDCHVLTNEGFAINPPLEDTYIASTLLEPELHSHKLDDLAFRIAGMKMTPITDLIGKGKSQITMAEVDVETVSDYACEDTDAAWQLWNHYSPQINQNGAAALYHDVEIPLVAVLSAMERRGIKVDEHVLHEQSIELGHDLKSIEQEIYQSVGREFNLNSPPQLAEVLYDDLQLLTGRKRSTRADILDKLAADGVEIAQKILDYRQRKKIQSTYLDALRKLIEPKTGRIHTTYHQVMANTGRISSTDPNLQNIPTRSDLGRRVRKAFIAEDGYKLISLDYSQIELRILAHITKDPGFLSAFSAGEDIHQRTAAEVFGVSLTDVTGDMRRKAKEINFGLNYGMSSYGLARRLGIDEKEAAQYISTYFTRYPNVQQYMDETTVIAQEHQFVKTIMGRKIPIAGIRDQNRMSQENAKRAAINAPVQGSAADLLKAAMVAIHNKYSGDADRAAILLTVHDELVLEVREDCVDEVMHECKELMEHAVPLDVPTPVECYQGNNWADLK